MTRKALLIGCVGAFLGIGFCTGLFALLIGSIFVATSPVVSAADEFLALLGNNQIAEAYAATASVLRSNQDEATFTQAVRESGLTNFASVSWQSRSLMNNEGSVKGNVTTRNGGTIPVEMHLVKEAGAWKVIKLHVDPPKP